MDAIRRYTEASPAAAGSPRGAISDAPTTIGCRPRDAIAFPAAVVFDQVHLLGYSIGRFVAKRSPSSAPTPGTYAPGGPQGMAFGTKGGRPWAMVLPDSWSAGTRTSSSCAGSSTRPQSVVAHCSCPVTLVSEKSALLDVAAGHAEATGTRVVRSSGAEFEAELSFSGLNHVLHPLLDGLAMLPPLHRRALSVALGLDAGAPSDRLVLSNAVIALLRDSVGTHPLLLVVDDLQWLDRASSLVLASAVRRLDGNRVGFLAALRTEAESFFDRAGLPTHVLEPLDDAAATALLKQQFPALAPRVRSSGGRSAGQPAGVARAPDRVLRDVEPRRRRLPDVLPLTVRLQELFGSRIRGLSESTIRVAPARRAGWHR